MLNITIFIFYSIKITVFGNWLPRIIFMVGGVFYFFIIAIIAMIILWWLIRLSRKKNESNILFLTNCILAVFNSFFLLYPYFIMLFFILSGFSI